MGRILFLVFLFAFVALNPAKAVGIITGGTDFSNYTYSYNTSAPAPPGWNNVGQVNGASGVYLGNGWVITAGHVGAGNFTLNGTTYAAVAGASMSVTNGSDTADLTLFRISPQPGLAPLILSTTDPKAMSTTAQGSSVVMAGFGGDGNNRTWGTNNITFINQSITLDGTPYSSNDFLTISQTFTEGRTTSNNLTQVVVGDSGGGDFIFNSSSSQWELAGINEVNGTVTLTINGTATTYTMSGMVQLSTYAAQINAIIAPPVDSPAMPFPALVILGCLLILSASYSLRMKTPNSHPSS